MAKERVYQGFWTARWIAEGAASLEEIAILLEQEAADLREMIREGIYMEEGDEVDNGTTNVYTKNEDTATKRSFVEPNDEDDDDSDYEDEFANSDDEEDDL